MSLDDKDYFRERAEAELRMAQRARDPAAVRAHYTLAGHYLDRVYSGSDQVASMTDAPISEMPRDVH